MYKRQILDRLARENPGTYTSAYKAKAAKYIGQRCTDCSGLISWYTGVLRGSYNYHDTAVERVGIDHLNESMVGWALWKPGHIGVYIGDGWCIEAKGINYEMCIRDSYKAMRKKDTVTLLASGWTGTGPYVQSIPVEGMTEDDEPILIKKIGKDATPEMVKAYNKAFGCIDDGDTENGQATFKCYNKKPTIDLTVGLKGV